MWSRGPLQQKEYYVAKERQGGISRVLGGVEIRPGAFNPWPAAAADGEYSGELSTGPDWSTNRPTDQPRWERPVTSLAATHHPLALEQISDQQEVARLNL